MRYQDNGDCDHIFTVMAPPTVLGALLRCEVCGLMVQMRFNADRPQDPCDTRCGAAAGTGTQGQESTPYALALAGQ